MGEKRVERILEWERTDGARRAFLLVTDESLSPDDVDYRTIEVSTYDASENRWETDEELEHIEAVTHVGIPQGMEDPS